MFSFTKFEQSNKYSFRVLHFSLDMRWSNKNDEKIKINKSIILPLLRMPFFLLLFQPQNPSHCINWLFFFENLKMDWRCRVYPSSEGLVPSQINWWWTGKNSYIYFCSREEKAEKAKSKISVFTDTHEHKAKNTV